MFEIAKQAMAEQGHTRSLSSKLNLKMNWDGQLGPSVAKLWLNKIWLICKHSFVLLI